MGPSVMGPSVMGPVVVGLDGSPTSRAAFAEAIDEATWRHTGVVAVHVVSYPIAMGSEYGAGLDLSLLREAAEQLLTDELAALEANYPDGFAVPVERLTALGHSGAELIKVAHGEGGREPASLVVLGSRGLGGFRALLVGSVTTYAVHHLTCRLLIVPETNRPDPIDR